MESKLLQSLKRSSDFAELKKNGRRFWASQWMLVSFQRNSKGELQYGLTVSRKVGNAVVRNKLKRWVRELLREHLKDKGPYEIDINFIFKPMDSGFYKGLPFEEFKKSMVLVFDKISKYSQS